MPTGGKEKRGTALLSVAVASGLAILKIGTFLLTGSVGILASAADSLMDVFASGVNYLAIRIADDPEDAEHRYGHGKAEGMAGLFQSLVIGASTAFLIFESVKKLVRPEPVDKPLVGVLVMGVSMGVSILLARRIRRVARENESLALKADSLHYVSDVLANGAVLLALVGYRLFGLLWLDPVVSLLICGYILWSVAEVFRDSFNNLMDRELPDEERERIVELIAGVPGTKGHHDLRTRRSGARRFIDVHIEMDRELTVVEAHRVCEGAIRAIEGGLANARATIHADPWPTDPDAYREPDPDRRRGCDGA